MAQKAITSHRCVSNWVYLLTDRKACRQANIMGCLIHLRYRRYQDSVAKIQKDSVAKTQAHSAICVICGYPRQLYGAG